MKTAQRPCPKWHPQPLRSSSAVLTHMAPSALAVILCTLPHGLLGNSPLLIFAPMYARQKVSKKMYVGCLWAHARKIQWQMRHRKVMVTSQKSLYSELRNHFIYSVFQPKWHDYVPHAPQIKDVWNKPQGFQLYECLLAFNNTATW